MPPTRAAGRLVLTDFFRVLRRALVRSTLSARATAWRVRLLAEDDPQRRRQRGEVGEHRQREGHRGELAELAHRRQIGESAKARKPPALISVAKKMALPETSSVWRSASSTVPSFRFSRKW